MLYEKIVVVCVVVAISDKAPPCTLWIALSITFLTNPTTFPTISHLAAPMAQGQNLQFSSYKDVIYIKNDQNFI